MTRVGYFDLNASVDKTYPPDRLVKTDYPSFDEEYIEWIDLLESVLAAMGRFTMIELGAGWGRWIGNAAAAVRQLGSNEYTLAGVEAEPSHFQMMVQHIEDNGLKRENFRLVRAAVARADGSVGFEVGDTPCGNPATYYGHRIGGGQMVDAVSLASLLEPFDAVDLIDLDVQGAEFDVLDAAAGSMDQKAKKIHGGTHSRAVESGLRSLFRRLGWRCLRDFPCNSLVQTEWGSVSFQDGVETWLNPAYFTVGATESAILQEKLEVCRQECKTLWDQLQVSEERMAGAFILRSGSAGWKVLQTITWVLTLIAPEGSYRRKLLRFLTNGGSARLNP